MRTRRTCGWLLGGLLVLGLMSAGCGGDERRARVVRVREVPPARSVVVQRRTPVVVERQPVIVERRRPVVVERQRPVVVERRPVIVEDRGEREIHRQRVR